MIVGSISKRIANIKKYVSLLRVLKDYNLMPHSEMFVNEFQMRCPFHGKDEKPSARIYDAGEKFHCFGCQRHFDVIDFFAEVAGIDAYPFGEKKKNVYRAIEQKYAVPKLAEVVRADIEKEKEKKAVSIEDRARSVEKKIIEKKRGLGLEKFAKMLYVLDQAVETSRPDLLERLTEKLEATV